MTHAQSDQADFTYDQAGAGPALDSAGLPARVAVFADRPSMRTLLAEDLEGAGFRTIDGGAITVLLDGPITLLGDVVMVDCPQVDGGILASLARLDMRAARAGAQLIDSTSMDALDDVFCRSASLVYTRVSQESLDRFLPGECNQLKPTVRPTSS